MFKVLIVCAQLSEARGIIDRFSAQPRQEETLSIWSEGVIPCCYDFAHGKIVICNVGIHSAQMAVAKYGRECQEIWNFGLAGALNPTYQIGDILSVTQVNKYISSEILDLTSQECMTSALPSFSLSSNLPHEVRLISSDFPIHGGRHRQNLEKNGDLVDMEGYGIAFAAHHLKKKCHIWKIISDFASPGGRALIHQHKSLLSDQMGHFIEERCQKTI